MPMVNATAANESTKLPKGRVFSMTYLPKVTDTKSVVNLKVT
jgi:hypothetical protein